MLEDHYKSEKSSPMCSFFDLVGVQACHLLYLLQLFLSYLTGMYGYVTGNKSVINSLVYIIVNFNELIAN